MATWMTVEQGSEITSYGQVHPLQMGKSPLRPSPQADRSSPQDGQGVAVRRRQTGLMAEGREAGLAGGAGRIK